MSDQPTALDDVLPDDPTGTAPDLAPLEDTPPQPSGSSVTPFLMFEGEAGAAMDAYRAAFAEHLPVTELRRDLFDASSPRGAEWEGKVLHGELEIAGQRLRFFDSFTPHGFSFTPAISLFVELPDDYGSSQRFTWVADRFGVTWQLNAA